jgi:hypothetical protein
MGLLDVFLPLIQPPRSDEELSSSLLSLHPHLACGYYIFGLVGLAILFSEVHDGNKHLLTPLMSRIHRRRQLELIFECMDVALTWALSTRDDHADFHPDTLPTRLPLFLILLMRNGFADKEADCGAIAKSSRMVYRIILRLWLLKNVNNGARLQAGDPQDYIMKDPENVHDPDPLIRSFLSFLNVGTIVPAFFTMAEYFRERDIIDGEARLADSIIRRVQFLRRSFKQNPDLHTCHWTQLWELHHVALLLCTSGVDTEGFNQALFNRALADQGFLKHMVALVRSIGSRTMEYSLAAYLSRGHPAILGLAFLDAWMGVLVTSVIRYPGLAVPCFAEMAKAGLVRCLVNGLYKSCDYPAYRLRNEDDADCDPWNAAVRIVPLLVRYCIHPSVLAPVHEDMTTISPKAFKAASDKLAGFLKAKNEFVPHLEDLRERVKVWHAGLEAHQSSLATFSDEPCLCDNPLVCVSILRVEVLLTVKSSV